MNKKIQYTLSALALLLALVCALTGCASSVKPVKSSAEEARVIGTLAGRDVRYEELRYLTLNFKNELEASYGEKIWDDPVKAEAHRAELEALVWDQIVSDYYAVISMADYYYTGGGSQGMFEAKEIRDAVQADVNKQAELCGGGRKKYLAGLDEINMTDSLFRFYLTAEHCADELFFIYYNDLGLIDGSDEAMTKYMHSEKFIRTNHVFLQGRTEENRALAEKIRDMLNASAEPEKEIILLKGKYCADYTMTTTHGAYFARYTSDYGTSYENAAFALRVGQISDVVEALSGYYVILRLPVEESYLQENFENFRNDILGSEFNVELSSFKEKLKLELNDYGKSIDLLGIK